MKKTAERHSSSLSEKQAHFHIGSYRKWLAAVLKITNSLS